MILIVDDDISIRSSLSFLLKKAGYETEAAATPGEALEMVRSLTPELLLVDMNFSLTTTGEEGLHLLRQVKILLPDVPVILMTAWGSISLAVEGMRLGAFDFVTKPWHNLMLLKSIRTALDLTSSAAKSALSAGSRRGEKDARFDKIIGKSPVLLELLDTVARIAPTNASVLITGESGTGKELIAEAIHWSSSRAKAPFVKVNLGGMSQSLFESEMFGHKKGAFTDAYTDRSGRFEMADKGTIFLDEIGELELSSQVKLLRVLQDQTFEVLGDSHPRKVDVRVVSATNRDLQEMVAERLFREDLYYRINLINIHLPALRERREDIPLLARYFAAKQVESNHLPQIEFSSDALSFLQRLPWPGNIRELKNVVERTILVSGKQCLEMSDFAKQVTTSTAFTGKAIATPTGMTLEELEKQTIIRALDTYKNNLSHVAAALGISRAALYRRLEKYGLSGENR